MRCCVAMGYTTPFGGANVIDLEDCMGKHLAFALHHNDERRTDALDTSDVGDNAGPAICHTTVSQRHVLVSIT